MTRRAAVALNTCRIPARNAGLFSCALLMLALLLGSSEAHAQVCASSGGDGPGGTLGGVVNTYYPGAATASAGATSISLGASRIDGAATPIAVGDLLLVMQMQDATINPANNGRYGDGVNGDPGSGATAVNNSGRYEYVVATGAVGSGGGTLALRGAGAGNGLLNTYTDATASATQGQRRFQVIRVPQYSSATLGSALTAASWNGATGGVLAVDIAGALALGGATVSVSGLGFRGGGGRQLNGGAGGLSTDYRNLAANNFNGMKGEGIAGTPRYVYEARTNSVVDTGVDGYPSGSSARGAPGNAGGGGTDGNPVTNDQNSGGGGGANGGAGGLGGNTWSTNLAVGGFGGAAFVAAPGQLVLGGGAGAGSRNNTPAIAEASSGGAGGGLVLLRAGSVSGSGTINANGADGVTADNDGSGGGGAGGSVLVFAASGGLAGLNVNARGGNGANNFIGGTGGSHGPGGGGGGGYVALSSAAGGGSVAGGTSGYTVSVGTNFGALPGATGVTNSAVTASQIPGASFGAACVPALTVTKTTSTASVTNSATGTTATYSITVANAANRSTATGAITSDALPTDFTYASTTSITLTGGATRPTISDPAIGATNPMWGTFNLPAGGQVQITFRVNIAPSVGSATYQNSALSTYLDPARTVSSGTTTAPYNSASSTAEDVTVRGVPVVALTKRCTVPANCESAQQQPNTDLTFTISYANNGGLGAQSFAIIDQVPANTDFRLGSMASAPGTTGLVAAFSYSNNGGTTYAYTPVSGGGGAPAGYDRLVTHVRWTFSSALSQTAPNNAGSVSFIVRIR